ncbi:MAG: hypothetical protein IT452_19675 [Planctomycetia bacterium]|nr:hypothetical protein [Planctomycetia bacterium]
MRALLLLPLLALPAAADPPAWKFRAGERYVYRCRASYGFTQTRVKDGKEVFCSAPQVEEMTLQATVLATGDDGAARLEFEVVAERIATTWADTGAEAEWDSAKDRDVCPGLERYAAKMGHKFTAVIGPDGAVRETKGARWPERSNLPAKERASKAERSAAETTRDPTGAEGWLQLIFGTTPREEAGWERTFDLPEAERFVLKADGTERAGGAACLRTEIETAAKKADGTEMPKERRRRGSSSFARELGRMMKVELAGAEEAVRYKPGKLGRIEWTVELAKFVAAPK